MVAGIEQQVVLTAEEERVQKAQRKVALEEKRALKKYEQRAKLMDRVSFRYPMFWVLRFKLDFFCASNA